MPPARTVKAILLNSGNLTPAGDGSFPSNVKNFETTRLPDGSLNRKEIPSEEWANFPVKIDVASAKLIRKSMNVDGWSTTIFFKDGAALQYSNCGIENNPPLDGDGFVELDLSYEGARWL